MATCRWWDRGPSGRTTSASFEAKLPFYRLRHLDALRASPGGRRSATASPGDERDALEAPVRLLVPPAPEPVARRPHHRPHDPQHARRTGRRAVKGELVTVIIPTLNEEGRSVSASNGWASDPRRPPDPRGRRWLGGPDPRVGRQACGPRPSDRADREPRPAAERRPRRRPRQGRGPGVQPGSTPGPSSSPTTSSGASQCWPRRVPPWSADAWSRPGTSRGGAAASPSPAAPGGAGPARFHGGGEPGPADTVYLGAFGAEAGCGRWVVGTPTCP